MANDVFKCLFVSGAHEAGLIFRARGTWDYWAVLVSSGGVKLVWVTEGRRKELKSCSGPMGEWTLIHVADQIADVSFSCGVGSQIKDEEREMDDVEEISDQHMGAAGLIAYGGGAQFRNVYFGPVDWTPDTGKIEKFKLTAKKVKSPPEEETAKNLARSDLTGLLDTLMRWCPNPSLCGEDPYRPSPRPP